MATGSSTKKPCCKCNKGGATFICDGCRQSFCLPHASDHRQELSQQMDNIGQEHDILKRDIDEQRINETLLSQINQWEKEAIEKIRSTAVKARADLKRLTEESRIQLSGLVTKLSDELRSNRESDDYTEGDLGRWMDGLNKLRKELEKPSEIEIVEDKPSSFHLIKIEKRNADGNDAIGLSPQNVARLAEEKFTQGIGPVLLSKDGYSAICTSNFESLRGDTTYSTVCGRLQYSCNIYHIQFCLNTSGGSGIFIGIIKSSETIVDESSALKSAYGHWSGGKPIAAGSCTESYNKVAIQPNDKVLLILDCASSKIRYIHERTQRCCELEVEQEICPLPWKLVVTLWYPNDKIKILNP